MTWLLKCAGLLLLVMCTASGQGKKIDTANSWIMIHVGKAGIFSAAGHEHSVKAPITSGMFEETGTARVELSVDARKLTVQPDPKVSAKDEAEVQDAMQRKVLESEKYPLIEFRSTSVQKAGEGTWKVSGDLALHGVTKPVTVSVKQAGDVYTGDAKIKQADFGIQPVSVAGGVVKVKNELDIRFEVRAASGR